MTIATRRWVSPRGILENAPVYGQNPKMGGLFFKISRHVFTYSVGSLLQVV